MNAFLLRMKFCGVKNIDKEITIDFAKSTLTKKADFSHSHVKSIYGANGSGKTAIVYAVEIYKNIVLSDSYITLNNANGVFENIINKKNKKCFIEMTFADINNDNQITTIFNHRIEISNESDQYMLTNERLRVLKGYNINREDKYEDLYNVTNGEIVYIAPFAEKEFIVDATKNLLDKQALPDIVIDKVIRAKSKRNAFFDCLYSVCLFAYGITIVLQSEDKDYIDYFQVNEQFEFIRKQEEKLPKEVFDQLLWKNKIPKKKAEYVNKEDIESFEKFTKNLCNFLKVFKNNLDGVEIKKEDNGDYYECEIIMLYKDNVKVNLKYESTGIKKLVQLYSALCNVQNEDIVFIDEFDANLHDVLLIKLIDYIVNYTNGQFIFTTHNLAPMSVLQNEKFSIDFLSDDSRIVSWRKNGNYTPESQYRKGMIEHSPFNIEPFSFIGVFGGE